MASQFNTNFYLCTICFKTSENEEECHMMMVPVTGASFEDQQRKPIEEDGRLITHAPRWFLTASKNQSKK